MHRKANFLVALTVMGALTTAALAQDIEYNGRNIRLDPKPTPVGNTWLLPVRATADKIGAKITRDGRYATITWQSNRAEFRVGDDSYTLNNRRKPFRHDSLERRGVLYLEARFFEDLTGNRLRVVDDRYGGNRPDEPYYGLEGRILYDNRELRFDRAEEPFMNGRTLMVPFRAMGNKVGAKLERTDDGKRVIIRHGRNEVVYDRGKTWYRINRQRRELSSTSRDRGDIYFVPIELFDAVTGGRVEWDRRRY
ncbi:MAG: stalk domain-containing protein [Fimbriimonadaceae bacterium]